MSLLLIKQRKSHSRIKVIRLISDVPSLKILNDYFYVAVPKRKPCIVLGFYLLLVPSCFPKGESLELDGESRI